MIEIRRIFAIILIIICCGLVANADGNKSFKCEGTTYSSTGRVNNSFAPTSTNFTWTDSKGNKYPIYMSASGSCYIVKGTKKDGKEDRRYLGKEISQDICKKLGKEYKGKKK